MSLSTSGQTAPSRTPLGSAYVMGREPVTTTASPSPTQSGLTPDTATPQTEAPALNRISSELRRSLSEVKGQAQFLLYLADQIEDSIEQLSQESDDCQASFLCKILGMYSAQLESKHQGLGDKIAETCQEVYVTVREFDASA